MTAWWQLTWSSPSSPSHTFSSWPPPELGSRWTNDWGLHFSVQKPLVSSHRSEEWLDTIPANWNHGELGAERILASNYWSQEQRELVTATTRRKLEHRHNSVQCQWFCTRFYHAARSSLIWLILGCVEQQSAACTRVPCSTALGHPGPDWVRSLAWADTGSLALGSPTDLCSDLAKLL